MQEERGAKDGREEKKYITKAWKNEFLDLIIYAHLDIDDIDRIGTQVTIGKSGSNHENDITFYIQIDDVIDHFLMIQIFASQDKKAQADELHQIVLSPSFKLLMDAKGFIDHVAQGGDLGYPGKEDLENPYRFCLELRNLFIEVRMFMRATIMDMLREKYGDEDSKWELAKSERTMRFEKLEAEELLKLNANIKFIMYLRYLGFDLPEDIEYFASDYSVCKEYENRVLH